MKKPPPVPGKRRKSRVGKILLIFFGGIFGLILIAGMSEPAPSAVPADITAPPPVEPQGLAETKPEDETPSFSLEDIAKGRGSWPKQVVASIPLEIEKGATIPAGAPLNLEDISSQGIVTVRVMDKLFRIDAADTDLQARAIAIREENRRQAEAIIQAEVASIEKERQQLLGVIGTEPRQDSWSGGTLAVKRYLKANLKDPDSVEYLDWTNPRISRVEEEPYWHVRVRYRTKNSFDGYVVESQNFYLRNDTVIFIQ